MDHKLEVERFCSKSSEIGLVVETPLLGLIMKVIGIKALLVRKKIGSDWAIQPHGLQLI